METLLNKIVSQIIVDAKGCWQWQGAKNACGYGKVCVSYDPKTKKCQIEDVHRVMYKLYNGTVPEGYNVCHSCDNPSCCNPSHLFVGTQKDNMADMTKKGRRSNGKFHSKAIQRGWTGELRKQQSNYMKARRKKEHEEKAKKAGVPESWKFCPECKKWFPRTPEFFHKNAARNDGFKSYCKPCSIAKDLSRRKKKLSTGVKKS